MDCPDLTIFDLVDTPVVVLRADPLALVKANAAGRAALGFEVSRDAVGDIDVFDSPHARAYLRRAVAEGEEPARFNLGFGTGERRRNFLCSARPMPQAPGLHVLTLIETTSESLGEWQGSLVEVLHALPVAIEIYDEDLNAKFFNEASNDLFMYEGQLIVHHDEWWRFGFPDRLERRTALKEWRHAFKAAKRAPNRPQITEWTVRCRDGQDRIMRFHYTWTGTLFILTLWEVTEQRRLEGRLRSLASSDPLTGLWNRRRFLEEADGVFARARLDRTPISVMMLDIDCFKAINDSHGHDAGDRVICATAQACRAVLRAGDGLARWGGEEFTILLPATALPEARTIAETLRQSVADTLIDIGSEHLRARISLGLACSTDADPDIASMLSRADRALYRAKAEGRNRVVVDLVDVKAVRREDMRRIPSAGT